MENITYFSEYPFFIVFEYITVLLLGLIFGSFATAITYRTPKNIPWAFPVKKGEGGVPSAYRSVCPYCRQKLGFIDLVPIFSWVFLQGKCRHCKKEIPLIYPMIEVLVLAACIVAYIILGFSAKLLLIMFLSPFLVSLLIIDLQYLILPNLLVGICGILGSVFLLYKAFISQTLSFSNFFLLHALGAFVFFFFAWGLRASMGYFLKKEALGFGDVKFFAVAGLWLGLFALPWFCFLSGIIGIVFGLLWRFIKKDPVFPFGPAIIVSFYILLLYNGSFL